MFNEWDVVSVNLQLSEEDITADLISRRLRFKSSVTYFGGITCIFHLSVCFSFYISCSNLPIAEIHVEGDWHGGCRAWKIPPLTFSAFFLPEIIHIWQVCEKKMGTDLGFESSPRTPGGRWAQAPLGCPALPSISLTDTWHKTSIYFWDHSNTFSFLSHLYLHKKRSFYYHYHLQLSCTNWWTLPVLTLPDVLGFFHPLKTLCLLHKAFLRQLFVQRITKPLLCAPFWLAQDADFFWVQKLGFGTSCSSQPAEDFPPPDLTTTRVTATAIALSHLNGILGSNIPTPLYVLMCLPIHKNTTF